MAQDQDNGKLHSDDDKEKLHPKVDSGDVSGQGRERRPDEEYPKQRNAGEFGTHGGPNKGGKKRNQRKLMIYAGAGLVLVLLVVLSRRGGAPAPTADASPQPATASRASGRSQ